MIPPIALFGQMKRDAGSFRIHTLNIARALCQFTRVRIVAEEPTALADDETALAPELSEITVLGASEYANETSHPAGEIPYYQFANNALHHWVLPYFVSNPGLVLLHDPNLYWLLSGHRITADSFLDIELGLCCGILARRSLDWERAPPLADILAHSTCFNKVILSMATGALFHSRHMADTAARKVPDLPVASIELIPNFLAPCPRFSKDDTARLKGTLNIEHTCPTFSLLGYQARHKRILEVLKAMVDIDEQHRFHLLCVGKWEESLLDKAKPYLHILRGKRRLTLEDRYVTEEQLQRYIGASDAVINLRYPTACESSGIACQAIGLGIPVIVNDYAGFTDLPNNAVVKAPLAEWSGDSQGLRAVLENVLRNPSVLDTKRAGAAMVGRDMTIDRYAKQYRAALLKLLEHRSIREPRCREQARIISQNESAFYQHVPDWRREPQVIVFVGEGLKKGLLVRVRGDADVLHVVHQAFGLLEHAASVTNRRRAIQAILKKLDRLPWNSEMVPTEQVVSAISYANWIFQLVIDKTHYSNCRFAQTIFEHANVGARCVVPLSVLELDVFVSLSGCMPEGESMGGWIRRVFGRIKYASETLLFRNGVHKVADTSVFGDPSAVIRVGSKKREREFGA